MNVIDAPLDGSGLHIGVVAGRFNDFVSTSLVAGTRARLTALGVADDDIHLGLRAKFSLECFDEVRGFAHGLVHLPVAGNDEFAFLIHAEKLFVG